MSDICAVCQFFELIDRGKSKKDYQVDGQLSMFPT